MRLLRSCALTLLALTGCNKLGPALDSLKSADSYKVVTTEEASVQFEVAAQGASQKKVTFNIQAGPTKGDLVFVNGSQNILDGEFQIVYVPRLNQTGKDVVTFTLSDGTTTSDPSTIEIEIAAVNDAPEAADGNLNTAEESSISGQLYGADVDGDDLIFSIESAPAKGSILNFNPSTGTYLFSPTTNATGLDSFTYKVSDGQTSSVTKTISINLSNVNDAPTAGSLTLSMRDRESLTTSYVMADPDGDALTIVIDSAPSLGTLVPSGVSGAFKYEPPALAIGQDVFTFHVTDGTAQSPTRSVTINLLPQLDGTWRVVNSQLFWDSEGFGALPFSCDPFDLTISHTASRLQIPSFTVNCTRGAVSVSHVRPATDVAISSYVAGTNLQMSTSAGAALSVSGWFSDSLGAALLLFNSDNVRMFDKINMRISQSVSGPYYVVLTETFSGNRYYGGIRRLTP
jgi:hypothetical protein